MTDQEKHEERVRCLAWVIWFRIEAAPKGDDAYRHAMKAEHYVVTTLADVYGSEYADKVLTEAMAITRNRTTD